jgi:hypothetical protein
MRRSLFEVASRYGGLDARRCLSTLCRVQQVHKRYLSGPVVCAFPRPQEWNESTPSDVRDQPVNPLGETLENRRRPGQVHGDERVDSHNPVSF